MLLCRAQLRRDRIPAERAARIIVKGIVARRREINFPWPMVTVLRLIRAMPNWLYDRFAAMTSPFKKRR